MSGKTNAAELMLPSFLLLFLTVPHMAVWSIVLSVSIGIGAAIGLLIALLITPQQ